MDAQTEVGMTLNYILDSSSVKYAEKLAIGMAMDEAFTYKDFYDNILALAGKLQNDGVKKGDRVAILSENSDRWGLAYLAIVRIGAIAVPVLPDSPEGDVHHILSEMKVAALFATSRQLDKIYEFNGELHGPIVTLDNSESFAGALGVVTFNAYMQEALTLAEQSPAEFAVVNEEDTASILYTSGTSGHSKAVMLSHKNLTANAYAAQELAEIPDDAVWLSILPISHTYEFTCGFILPLLCGARIAYAGKTPTPAILQKICQHEKPFAIFAVPLVLEKIYKKRVLPQIEKSSVATLACKTSFGRKLIYRKVGKKLIDFFGGKIQLMGIGGAALNPEVEQFLYDARFPYLIGYGMTESAPLLAGGPLGDSTIAPTSTGKPIPGVEIRIENPDPETGIGEIVACGPNVMLGYYNDEEETARNLSADHWLSTGDLGRMDEAGNLYITGRQKNIIVTSNGENVYPEIIEHKLNSYKWVVESLVIEKNNNLEAHVYPDYECIDEQTHGKTGEERRQVIERFLEEMRVEVNEGLTKASRLGKICERREPFTKTATQKIKRYLYDV